MPTLQDLVSTADDWADRAPHELPAAAAPLLDIGAEQHARSEGRLFAS